MKNLKEGKLGESMEQLKLFSNGGNYIYWFLYIEDEPILKSLKNHSDFEKTMQKIKDKFWAKHERIKEALVDEGLI
ncbi:MAG: hypothetical protein P8O16_01620 [Algoriphagus sp.]|uniref:hypothetical protein n=1 Tax=Algoriphagus sp. TaxID=1872435 RepID=UPI002603D1B0|nr:hypothetical protein [Algoriphagus sp.]MDG1275947.1 hypothetical protein [Algoriphagus sp.]